LAGVERRQAAEIKSWNSGIMSVRAGPFAFATPILWVLGCTVVLVSPLIRFAIAQSYNERVLQDTYVVASPARRTIELAAIFGCFATWYYLFSGYAYSDLLGKVHFWLSFSGFIAMFVPQVIVLAVIVGRVEDASSPLWGGGDPVRQ